ncbi:hypothetical protein Srut_14080 [Streptomyces rutgersensis]|nr:hypothetical protein Srut_14080 [Streptomyces rutgersensis]
MHVNIECEDGWVAKIGVSDMEATGPYSHSITKWVTEPFPSSLRAGQMQGEDGLDEAGDPGGRAP